jgi:hypothetical protein
MTKLTENIFAAEVPVDAIEFEITFGKDKLVCWTKDEGNYDIELPPGSYSFLCTSTEITEEQAAAVVRIREANGYPIGYKDYQNDDESYRNAVDSFHSLLRSKSLGRVAIIKKV